MKVDLIRLEEHSVEGTFGTMRINGQAFCVTLEPPDKNNAQWISNIPPGKYKCKRYSSAKYPRTFEIIGVPMRSRVLFHSGNTVDDTHGCVILGQYFGKLRDNRAVLNSGNTFAAFMGLLEDEEGFDFEIIEV